MVCSQVVTFGFFCVVEWVYSSGFLTRSVAVATTEQPTTTVTVLARKPCLSFLAGKSNIQKNSCKSHWLALSHSLSPSPTLPLSARPSAMATPRASAPRFRVMEDQDQEACRKAMRALLASPSIFSPSSRLLAVTWNRCRCACRSASAAARTAAPPKHRHHACVSSTTSATAP